MDNFTRAKFNQQHIDDAAVALAHRGLFVTIRPGSGGPYVAVRLAGGSIVIRQDPTVASLYSAELSVDGLGVTRRIGDRLPLLVMVELVLHKALKDPTKARGSK